MNRKIVAVWVSLAMLFGFIVIVDIITDLTPSVKATTLYVNETGSGGAFTSIQDAINASNDGDTVYVYCGTYFENVIVNKTINLTGEDRNNTIIDGGGSGDVIYVSANWVNVSGFTVTDSGAELEDAGIELNNVQNCGIIQNNISNNEGGIILDSSSSNTISNNSISNNYDGLWFHSSSSNIISNNSIYLNTDDGIWLYSSSNNTISNNNIDSNNWNGIFLYSSSNSNTISNNSISNNEDGMDIASSSSNTIFDNSIYSNNRKGIWLYPSSNSNTISNNSIHSNNDDGICLNSSSNNIISNNSIYSNDENGIMLDSGSNNNTIIYNGITSNTEHGLYITLSSHNLIHHNNIINNANQAYDNMDDNLWNDTYLSGGNYWSDFDESSEGAYDDYQGQDQDVVGSDGIVDNGTIGGGGKNPYVIDADSQDNYPLIKPIGNYIFLYEGWNLISIPFIQSDTNLSSVLNSITGSYKAVQWYNATDSNDHWKHNSISKPSELNDLDIINHKMGFWIYITEPGGVLFQYFGIQPTENQSITLYPGWNLVGYPSLSNKNRTNAMNNITFGNDVDSIWTYKAANQKWEEMGESDYFKVGKGYYIHAKSECEWEVPL